MVRVFLIAVILFTVGLVGASAFNPDDGFMAPSETV